MKVILETDQLLLREYMEEKRKLASRLNSDPEVLRFVRDPERIFVKRNSAVEILHVHRNLADLC